MTPHSRSNTRQTVRALAVVFCTACLAHAAQTQPTNQVVLPKSTFVTNDVAGKDPFFPNSKRRVVQLEPNQGEKTPQPVGVSALRLLGITTDTTGKRIALINNLTFAEGEEHDEVRVENGKLKVKCIEIRDKSVIVTIEGQSDQHELALPERLLRSSPE